MWNFAPATICGSNLDVIMAKVGERQKTLEEIEKVKSKIAPATICGSDPKQRNLSRTFPKL
jgi:hypothetical protein